MRLQKRMTPKEYKSLGEKKKSKSTPTKYPRYVPNSTLVDSKVGRAKKYKWSTDETIFDSEGEAFIYLWIAELKSKGYIDSVEMQPKPFELSPPIKRKYRKQLKTRIKMMEEHVETSQIYTPDFLIKWNQKAFDDNLVIEFSSDTKKESHHLFAFNGESYLEAKPDSLNMKVYDDQNMIRLFKSKQKEIYERFFIYINLVFHNKLFHQTFMPARYTINNKSITSRGIKYEYRTFDEFLKDIKKPDESPSGQLLFP